AASVVNGGHNDLLVGVLVLAAVTLVMPPSANPSSRTPRRTGGEFAPPAVQIHRQFEKTGRLVGVGLALAAAVMVERVVLLAAARALSRLRARTPVTAVGGAMLAFLLSGAYLMAWYPAWVLPVLALRWRARLSLIAAGYAALLLLAHVELPSQLHSATL